MPRWRMVGSAMALLLSGAAASFAAPVPCVGEDAAAAEVARTNAKTALRTISKFVSAPDKETDDLLAEWFGSAGPEVRKSVEEVLAKSLAWVDAFGFYCEYNNDGSMAPKLAAPSGTVRVDRAGSLFAYVDPADLSKVYLGLAFYSAHDTGYDSKLGTVVHELTHFKLSGKTDDVEYGQAECRELAKRSPKEALKNADSYQYFVEGWLAAR